jgi:hypothetical protein
MDLKLIQGLRICVSPVGKTMCTDLQLPKGPATKFKRHFSTGNFRLFGMYYTIL